jgi:hypothetical protein
LARTITGEGLVFRGKGIVSVVDELTAIRGVLAHLRADNGPEPVSRAVKA